MATLTYSYADSTVVLGPLSAVAEPQAYDLCAQHATSLTVPRGWEVVRLPLRESDLRRTDDLLDIADALKPSDPVPPPVARRPVATSDPTGPVRHLRSVNDRK